MSNCDYPCALEGAKTRSQLAYSRVSLRPDTFGFVYAHGYSLKLIIPYVSLVLYIRKPGDDNETLMRFADDDPFFSEISNFIDTEDSGADQILSSYEDAIRTYEFTWAIREANEKSAAALKAAAV